MNKASKQASSHNWHKVIDLNPPYMAIGILDNITNDMSMQVDF